MYERGQKMIKFKKIAAVAMSVCMTLGILGDANLGLDQQVDADDKLISQIEIEIPNFNLAAGEITGITGGASPFSSSTEGVDYASFGIVSCKNSKGEEQVYNGESDALVEGFEYTVQAYVDLKKGYSVAKNINFILKCKDVNIAIDMTQVPDAAPYTYQIGYKVKSLDVLIQESVYAGATLINSGAKLNIPSNTSTYDYYKFVLPTAANIEFDAGNLSDRFEIVVYDSSYKAVSTVSKSDGTFEKYKWKSEEMKAGTYYLSVKAMSSGSTKQITFNTYPIVTNNEESKPEAVNLPADGKSSKITWLQVENGGKKYDYYYKLVVNEKAYYHFDIGSGSTVVLYKGVSTSTGELANTSDLLQASNEYLLNKGTYLLKVRGASAGVEYIINIKSRDFKDIKKLSGDKTYTVYKGSKKQITINMDPVDNESKITYSGALTNYDVDKKEYTPKNKPLVDTSKLGKFTGTATTSEGVKFTVTINVVPGPTQIDSAVATTKSKSKASIVLNWKDTGNFYKLYQKNGKKWKMFKTTSSNKLTIKTKANKKFTIKIEACYKKGSKIVNSSMGSEVKVFTAPAKKPKIKSVKQKGKTRYVKPYRKRYIDTHGWPFYRTEGNQSFADVVIKYSKVKGAKYYEPSSGKKDAYNNQWYIKNNKLLYVYKGKLSAKKSEKIKIRTVFTKGVCTAYGPWSKQKVVKINTVK